MRFISIVFIFLASLNSIAQERASRNVQGRGMTIVDRERQSSPAGNIGGREDRNNSNSNNGNNSTLINTVLSMETSDALKSIQKLKQQWAFIKKLMIGKKVIDILTSPPSENMVEQLRDITSNGWVELAKAMRTMADAEKAQIDHFVEIEAFLASERSKEANENNAPDKERRRIEAEFWQRFNSLHQVYLQPDLYAPLVEVTNLGVEAWTYRNESILVATHFRITNLNFHLTKIRLQFCDSIGHFLYDKKGKLLYIEKHLKVTPGSYSINCPVIGQYKPEVLTNFVMPYNSLNLPYGTHQLKLYVSIIVESQTKSVSEWKNIKYTYYEPGGFETILNNH